MKILVTGAAGYIGASLVHMLADSPRISSILLYDILSHSNYGSFLSGRLRRGEKLRFVLGDVLDSRLLGKEMKGVDAVVHLAGLVTTPFANFDSHSFEQVNHWGTAEVAYAIEELGIKKVVYLSSTSVYGDHKSEMGEESVPTPNTFYATSKLRGERHIDRLRTSCESVILRAANVYGPNPSVRFDAVINRFMFDANYLNRITIRGSGHQVRSFIHVDRLAQYIFETVTNTIEPGIYNLVDENMEIIEVALAIKELYPGLEFVFSDQHLQLPHLNVSPESKIFNQIQRKVAPSFKELLGMFRSRFAF